VFEEAYGEDQILFDLLPEARRVVGMDVAWSTARAARQRCPAGSFFFLAGDVRELGFPSGTFDLVVSTSTLDHFDSRAELRAAIRELARVLRPGGTLVITLDNPANPTYYLLRWMSRFSWAPFSLGRTASAAELNRSLREAGMEVLGNDWLIHNPRLLSTAIFLGLRRALGAHADTPIRGLLKIFALLGRLPTRRFSACFVAACARKR